MFKKKKGKKNEIEDQVLMRDFEDTLGRYEIPGKFCFVSTKIALVFTQGLFSFLENS